MKGLTTFFAANFAVSRYSVRTYDKLDHKQQIFAKITATTYINSVPMRVQMMYTVRLLIFHSPIRMQPREDFRIARR